MPHQSAGAGAVTTLEEIKKLALTRPAQRTGLARIRGERIAVIAEVDSAHPRAVELADRYEADGAGAIALAGPADSDAAELEGMARISARLQVPVLALGPAETSQRMWQARAGGADLVMLRAAALSDSALLCLVERAESIGMDAVVEVRGGGDLVRALRAGARAVLLRPAVEAATAAGPSVHELLSMVPDGVVKVAECGPGGRSDLIACARSGADAVLVGASLAAGAAAGSTIADLAAMGAHPALTSRGRRAA
jgi:indole-3-glycerol phosphate synthase